MIEIIKQLLPVLLPLLLELLKKDKDQREAAHQMGSIMQAAGLAKNDPWAIMVAGIFQRIGEFSEEQQASLVSDVEYAVAEMRKEGALPPVA